MNMNEIFWFVGIYLTLLIGITLWGKKKSPADFLIANRELSTWTSSHSLSATSIGGGLILVGGAFIYQFGISAIWFFVGKILGYGLLGIFAHKIRNRIHEKNYFTLADYFFDFHGSKVGRFIAGLSFFILVGWTVVGLISGAKIIMLLSQWSYEISLSLMVGVILFYTLIGGFKSVVKTDYLQFIALFIIFTLFLFVLGENFESIKPTQWDIWGAGTKNILPFFIAGALLPFSAMEVWQRIYAIQKEKTIASVMGRFSLVFFLFGLILCLTIMLIRTLDKNLQPDLALIEGILKFFPETFAGLGTVAFFAAIMSSVDSYLFAASSSFVQYLWDWKKKATPEKLEKWIKRTVFLLSLGVLLFGLAWQNLIDVTVYLTTVTMVVALLTLWSWGSKQKVPPFALICSGSVGLIGLHAFPPFSGVTPQLVLGALSSTILGGIIGQSYYHFFLKK